jgi:hypothetical protein
MSEMYDHIIRLTEEVAGMKADVARIPGIEDKIDMLLAKDHERSGISKIFKYLASFFIGLFGGASAQ